MENPEIKPILLTLYADGEIFVPNAKTYGDILAPMDIIIQKANIIRQRLFRIPLQTPPEA